MKMNPTIYSLLVIWNKIVFYIPARPLTHIMYNLIAISIVYYGRNCSEWVNFSQSDIIFFCSLAGSLELTPRKGIFTVSRQQGANIILRPYPSLFCIIMFASCKSCQMSNDSFLFPPLVLLFPKLQLVSYMVVQKMEWLLYYLSTHNDGLLYLAWSSARRKKLNWPHRLSPIVTNICTMVS